MEKTKENLKNLINDIFDDAEDIESALVLSYFAVKAAIDICHNGRTEGPETFLVDKGCYGKGLVESVMEERE